MLRKFIGVSVSAAALLWAAGLAAQERQPGGEGGAKAQTERGAGEKREAPRAAERGGEKPGMKAEREGKEGMKPEGKKAGSMEEREGEKARPTEKGEGKKAAAKERGEGKKTESMDKGERKEGADRKAAEPDRAGARKDSQRNDTEGAGQRTDKDHGTEKFARRPHLDEKQRTTVTRSFSESIRSEHVERITNVDFNVRAGVIVPARYHFYPLPVEVLDILPQYRGYDYVVAGDDIVIVEPDTHRIVYTMPEGGGASGEADEGRCN